MIATIATHPKKALMIGLVSTALLLWGYHLTRIDIEFPESHVDGLLVCSPDYNPGPANLSEQERTDTIFAYHELFKGALAASTNIDGQVIAAVVQNDQDIANRINELSGLIAQYPANQLANLHFLNACSKTSNHPACDAASVEQANAVNTHNAASWALLAIYRDNLDAANRIEQAYI